jgi:hypothetical protein
MKFKYDLNSIISALDYNDLKGLVTMINQDLIKKQNYSASELENIFKDLFCGLSGATKSQIESLMLSCARVNSIGY